MLQLGPHEYSTTWPEDGCLSAFPSLLASAASAGRQATLSVGTYRMVRVGETRPSAGMYRDSRKSPFSPRSSHVDAPSVKGASRGRLMTGSPESILVPVYGRVVTPDPWRHVTFVNYQNGYGRAEDWWNASRTHPSGIGLVSSH